MMRILGGLLVGVVALGAGCYHDEYATQPGYAAARPVTVAVPPPAPIDEQPTVEPFAGAVWMSGYWDWRPDLGRHVWVGGHWSAAPRQGVAFMPPSWRSDGHGQYYRVPGRWVTAPTRDAYGRHIAYDAYGRPHYF